MNNIKSFKLGIISLATLMLLAACGDDAPETPDVPEPGVEEPAPAEEPGTTDDAGGDDATTDPETTPPADSETNQASAGILSMDFQVSFDDAIQTFYDTFNPDVKIEEIVFDRDDGVYRYEISGWDQENNYELEIDAETGAILDQSTERDDDHDDALDLENVITPEEAMNAAIEVSDTDVIEEWDLEIEFGRPVYDIDFEHDDNDQKIDANTGEVL